MNAEPVVGEFWRVANCDCIVKVIEDDGYLNITVVVAKSCSLAGGYEHEALTLPSSCLAPLPPLEQLIYQANDK